MTDEQRARDLALEVARKITSTFPDDDLIPWSNIILDAFAEVRREAIEEAIAKCREVGRHATVSHQGDIRYVGQADGALACEGEILSLFDAEPAQAASSPTDTVPTPTSRSDAEDNAWTTLVCAAIQWAEYMDQWDKFQFDTKYGAVYVSLLRQTPWPDDYMKMPPDVQAAIRIAEGG